MPPTVVMVIARFAEHSNDFILTVSFSLSEINLYYLFYVIYFVWSSDSIQTFSCQGLQQH